MDIKDNTNNGLIPKPKENTNINTSPVIGSNGLFIRPSSVEGNMPTTGNSGSIVNYKIGKYGEAEEIVENKEDNNQGWFTAGVNRLAKVIPNITASLVESASLTGSNIFYYLNKFGLGYTKHDDVFNRYVLPIATKGREMVDTQFPISEEIQATNIYKAYNWLIEQLEMVGELYVIGAGIKGVMSPTSKFISKTARAKGLGEYVRKVESLKNAKGFAALMAPERLASSYAMGYTFSLKNGADVYNQVYDKHIKDGFSNIEADKIANEAANKARLLETLITGTLLNFGTISHFLPTKNQDINKALIDGFKKNYEGGAAKGAIETLESIYKDFTKNAVKPNFLRDWGIRSAQDAATFYGLGISSTVASKEGLEEGGIGEGVRLKDIPDILFNEQGLHSIGSGIAFATLATLFGRMPVFKSPLFEEQIDTDGKAYLVPKTKLDKDGLPVKDIFGNIKQEYSRGKRLGYTREQVQRMYKDRAQKLLIDNLKKDYREIDDAYTEYINARERSKSDDKTVKEQAERDMEVAKNKIANKDINFSVRTGTADNLIITYEDIRNTDNTKLDENGKTEAMRVGLAEDINDNKYRDLADAKIKDIQDADKLYKDTVDKFGWTHNEKLAGIVDKMYNLRRNKQLLQKDLENIRKDISENDRLINETPDKIGDITLDKATELQDKIYALTNLIKEYDTIFNKDNTESIEANNESLVNAKAKYERELKDTREQLNNAYFNSIENIGINTTKEYLEPIDKNIELIDELEKKAKETINDSSRDKINERIQELKDKNKELNNFYDIEVEKRSKEFLEAWDKALSADTDLRRKRQRLSKDEEYINNYIGNYDKAISKLSDIKGRSEFVSQFEKSISQLRNDNRQAEIGQIIDSINQNTISQTDLDNLLKSYKVNENDSPATKKHKETIIKIIEDKKTELLYNDTNKSVKVTEDKKDEVKLDEEKDKIEETTEDTEDTFIPTSSEENTSSNEIPNLSIPEADGKQYFIRLYINKDVISVPAVIDGDKYVIDDKNIVELFKHLMKSDKYSKGDNNFVLNLDYMSTKDDRFKGIKTVGDLKKLFKDRDSYNKFIDIISVGIQSDGYNTEMYLAKPDHYKEELPFVNDFKKYINKSDVTIESIAKIIQKLHTANTNPENKLLLGKDVVLDILNDMYPNKYTETDLLDAPHRDGLYRFDRLISHIYELLSYGISKYDLSQREKGIETPNVTRGSLKDITKDNIISNLNNWYDRLQNDYLGTLNVIDKFLKQIELSKDNTKISDIKVPTKIDKANNGNPINTKQFVEIPQSFPNYKTKSFIAWTVPGLEQDVHLYDLRYPSEEGKIVSFKDFFSGSSGYASQGYRKGIFYFVTTDTPDGKPYPVPITFDKISSEETNKLYGITNTVIDIIKGWKERGSDKEVLPQIKNEIFAARNIIKVDDDLKNGSFKFNVFPSDNGNITIFKSNVDGEVISLILDGKNKLSLIGDKGFKKDGTEENIKEVLANRTRNISVYDDFGNKKSNKDLYKEVMDLVEAGRAKTNVAKVVSNKGEYLGNFVPRGKVKLDITASINTGDNEHISSFPSGVSDKQTSSTTVKDEVKDKVKEDKLYEDTAIKIADELRQDRIKELSDVKYDTFIKDKESISDIFALKNLTSKEFTDNEDILTTIKTLEDVRSKVSDDYDEWVTNKIEELKGKLVDEKKVEEVKTEEVKTEPTEETKPTQEDIDRENLKKLTGDKDLFSKFKYEDFKIIAKRTLDYLTYNEGSEESPIYKNRFNEKGEGQQIFNEVPTELVEKLNRKYGFAVFYSKELTDGNGNKTYRIDYKDVNTGIASTYYTINNRGLLERMPTDTTSFNMIIDLSEFLKQKYNIDYKVVNVNDNWHGKFGTNLVYLNSKHLLSGTTLHEYLHPLMLVIEKQYPEVHKSLVKDFKNLLTDEVRNYLDNVYNDKDYLNEDGTLNAKGINEAIIQLTTEKSINNIVKKGNNRLIEGIKSLILNLKNALKGIFDVFAEQHVPNKIEDITTLQSLADFHTSIKGRIDLSKYSHLFNETLFSKVESKDFLSPEINTMEEQVSAIELISSTVEALKERIEKVSYKEVKENKDQYDLKRLVATQFREWAKNAANDNHKDLMNRIAKSISESKPNDRSSLWNKSRDYLNTTYKLNVTSFEDIEDKELSSRFSENNTQVSTSDKASYRVKRLIKKTIETDKEGKPIINPITGKPKFVNYNVVFNDFLNKLTDSYGVNDMLTKLGIISKYNPSVAGIIKNLVLPSNQQLLAEFYHTFAKGTNDKLYATIESNKDGKLKVSINHAYIPIGKSLANKWTDNLAVIMKDKTADEKTKLNTNIEKFYNTVIADLADTSKQTNVDKLITDIANGYTKLGIDIRESEIKNFLDRNSDNAIKVLKDIFIIPLPHVGKHILGGYNKEGIANYDIYNRLNKIGNAIAEYRLDGMEKTFITAAGEKEYMISEPSFLTNLISKYKSDNPDVQNLIKEEIELYKTIKGVRFSNWIKDNENAFSTFSSIRAYRFGWLKDEQKEGLEYADMTPEDWQVTNFLYYLHNIDGNKNVKLPFPVFSDSGQMWHSEIPAIRISSKDLKENGTLSRSSKLYKAVSNTFLQELDRMLEAKELMFEDNGMGGYKLKDNLPDGLRENYHFNGYDENNKPIFVDEDGNATGNVFKFHNIPELNNIKIDLGEGKQVGLFNKGLILDLHHFLDNTIESKVPDKDLNNKIRNAIFDVIDKHIEDLITERYNSHLQYKDRFKTEYNHIGDINTSNHFRQVIAEYALNNYLNNVEIGNFWLGVDAEYKDSDNKNKRAKELISPSTNLSMIHTGETFNQITVHDIKTKSNIIDEIENRLKDKVDNKLLKTSTKNYYNIESTDGQEYITVDAGIRLRMEIYGEDAIKDFIEQDERGRYKYKDNILSKDAPELTPFKLFYYDRKPTSIVTTDGKVYNQLFSTQVKSSVKELTDAFVGEGTSLREIKDYMEANNIHRMSYKSTVKAGANNVGNLLIDGKFSAESLKNIKVNTLSYKATGKQQDVVPHSVDEKNNMGKQVKIIAPSNIYDDTTYKIGDKTIKGNELFTHYDELTSSIVRRESEKLVKELSDINVVSELLRESASTFPISENNKLSYELDELGRPLMSFNHPSLVKRTEQVLTAMFTNRVNNFKVNGAHVTLVSDALRGNKLKSYFEDGQLVHEIALSVWSDKLYKEDGTLMSLDEIPNELKYIYGYRIPHSGKHSGAVLKVVEILPKSEGSVIVASDHLIAQMGYDFDIDSIYAHIPNFYKTKDGKLHTYEFSSKEEELLDRYRSYINRESSKSIRENIGNEEWERTQDVNNAAFEEFKQVLNETDDYIENKEIIKARYKALKEETKTNIDEEFKLGKEIFKQLPRELQQNYFSKEYGFDNLKGFDKTLAYKTYTESKFKELVEVEDSKIYTFEYETKKGKIIKENITAGELKEIYSNMIDNYEDILDYNPIFKQLSEGKKSSLTDLFKKYIDISNLDEIKTKNIDEFNKEYFNLIAEELGLKNLEEFSKQNIYDQNSREAIENEFINVFKSIYGNDAHLFEQTRPAVFKDSSDAADKIRLIAEGKNVKKYNNPDTQEKYREDNVNGKKVLAIAASYNPSLRIFQKLNARVAEKYSLNKVYEIKDLEERVGISLDDIKKKYDVINETETTVTINHKNLGFTNDGKYDSMFGDLISDRVGQLVDHMADIVKSGGVINLNKFSANLVNTLVTFDGDYEYAYGFIAQNSIKDVIKERIKNPGYEVSRVKNKYATLLYQALKKSNPKLFDVNDKSIQSIDADIKKKREWVFTSKNMDVLKDHYNYDSKNPVKFTNKQLLKVLELGRNIDNKSEEDKIKYYKAQLYLLDEYKRYNKTANAIGEDTQRLNTHKVGIQSSLYLNDKYINGILKNMVNEYPKILRNNLYTSLQEYLRKSNMAASNTLSKHFISQSNEFKDTLGYILGDLPTIHGDRELEVNNKLSTFLTSKLLTEHHMFNIDEAERVRILGVKDRYNRGDIKVDENMIFGDFKQLSAAEQLEVVRKRLNLNPNEVHIINYLESRLSPYNTNKNKFQFIDFKNTYSEVRLDDELTKSLQDMYNSGDPYQRELASSLIKFNYLTFGLSFGNNSYSKLIPNSLLIREGVGNLLNIKNEQLHEGTYKLPIDVISEFIRATKSIIPKVELSTYYSPYSDSYIKRKGTPSWVAREDGVIIFNNVEENTKYADNNILEGRYVKYYDKKLKKEIIYEKLDHTKSSELYIYFPVNTLGSWNLVEYGETSVIPENNTKLSRDEYINKLQDEYDIKILPKIYSERIESTEEQYSEINSKDYTATVEKYKNDLVSPLRKKRYTEEQSTSQPSKPINIYYGNNENKELSNLATRPFEYKGKKYYSVEHAYQSLKSGVFDEETYNKYKSGGIKKQGNKGTNKDISISLMKDLILESFKQNESSKQLLLATGNAKFTHLQDNTIWKTEFPKLLAEVRSELRGDVNKYIERDLFNQDIQEPDIDLTKEFISFGDNKISIDKLAEFIAHDKIYGSPNIEDGTIEYDKFIEENKDFNKIIKKAWDKMVTFDGKDIYPTIYEFLEDLLNSYIKVQVYKDPAFIESLKTSQLGEFLKDIDSNPLSTNEMYEQRKSRLPIEDADRFSKKAVFMNKVFAKHGIEIGIVENRDINGHANIISDINGKLKINYNPSNIRKDSLFHEWGHVLVDMLGGLDNEFIKLGVEQLRGTKLWNDIHEVYGDRPDVIKQKEVLTTAIGIEADKLFTEKEQIGKFRFWVNRLFDRISEIIHKVTNGRLGNEQEVAKKLALDLIQGRLRSKRTGKLVDYFNESREFDDDLEPEDVQARINAEIIASRTDKEREAISDLIKSRVNYIEERYYLNRKLIEKNKDKIIDEYKDDAIKMNIELEKVMQEYYTTKQGLHLLKALQTTYEHDVKNINNLSKELNKFKDDYLGVNILDLSKPEQDYFNNKLRESIDFVKVYESIDNLISTSSVEDAKLTDIDKEINNIVSEHKKLSSLVSDMKNSNTLLLYKHTNSMINKYLTGKEYRGLDIDGLKEMLSNLKDENPGQYAMNAVFDSHIPMLQLAGKRYWDIKLEAIPETKDVHNELFRQIEKYLGIDKLTLSDITKYKSSMEKFISKSGHLINEYDWDAFNEAKREARDKFYRSAELQYESQREQGSLSKADLDNKDFYIKKKVAAMTSKWFKDNTETMSLDKIAKFDEEKRKTLSPVEYKKWYLRNVNESGKYYRVGGDYTKPSSKYKNAIFSSFTDKDKEMHSYIHGLLTKYGNKFTEAGWIPAFPKTNVKLETPEGLEEYSINDVHGDPIYKIPFHGMMLLNQKPEIRIRERKLGETYSQYKADVLETINSMGRGKFTSLEDVYRENEKIRRENEKRHADALDRNLIAVLPEFIQNAIMAQKVADLETELKLYGKAIENAEFIKKSGLRIDKIKGDESESLKHFNHFMRMVVYGKFSDKAKGDAFFRKLNKYTVWKGLALNIHGGFKNLFYSLSQATTEIVSGETGKATDAAKAAKFYNEGLASYFRDAYRVDGKASSLQSAIIKEFGFMYDKFEKDKLDKTGYTERFFNTHMLRDGAFFLMHSTNHIIQSNNAFKMMYSHKLIDGKIVSLIEYKNGKLPEITKKEASQMTPDEKKDFNEKYNSEVKKIEKEFEDAPSVMSLYELRDGRASLKRGIKINNIELNKFKEKIIGVNQSFDGIYNNEDKPAMERKVWFQSVMMFRHWMKPGIDKRYGSRGGINIEGFWNERRQNYDAGMYKVFTKYLTQPFTKENRKLFKEEEINKIETFKAIIQGYGNFIRNASLYWKTLNPYEQAAIKKATTEFAMLAALMATTNMFYNWLHNNMEENIRNSRLLNWQLYQMQALTNNLYVYTPFGLLTTGGQLLDSPMVSYRTIMELYTLATDIIKFPFQEEDERIYKRGTYKNEYKVVGGVKKQVPILNQIERIIDSDTYHDRYKMFDTYGKTR